MKISRSRVIKAKAEKIWPYLVELDKELKWRKPEVVDLQFIKGKKTKPGTIVKGTTVIMGNKDTYQNEITEVEKNKRLAWKAVPETSDVGSSGEYLLEDHDKGTKATITIDYIPQKTNGWIMLPVIKIMAPRTFDRFLRRLAGLVE